MDRQQLTENLTAHNYGASTERIGAILEKLTDEELKDLMYVCARASEKIGWDAFTDEKEG